VDQPILSRTLVVEHDGERSNAEIRLYLPYESHGSYWCRAECSGAIPLKTTIPFNGRDEIEALAFALIGLELALHGVEMGGASITLANGEKYGPGALGNMIRLLLEDGLRRSGVIVNLPK
jgi:hypothetical protein